MDTIAQINGRHTSNLHRYSTGTLNKILKLVEAAGARATGEIFAIIEGMTDRERQAFIAGSFKYRRSQKLKEAIEDLSRDIRNITAARLREGGRELTKYEIGFTSDLLSKLTVVASFTPAAVSTAYAAAVAKPMLGVLLRDELGKQYSAIHGMLNSTIREGLVGGETNDQVVRRIRGTRAARYKDGILGGPVKTNIERIVRTNANHVANVAREHNLEAMGVSEVQWRSTLDGRTSKICAMRDLEVYPLFEGPRPPAHPNCRSIMEPYIEGFEGNRPFVRDARKIKDIPSSERAGIGGQVSANTSYPEWFSSQPASFQREWLGAKRYKLYKSGKFPVSRFADPRTGREYSLEILRSMDAEVFSELGI